MMRRALVGFSDHDLVSLDAASAAQNVSRAQLIRQAVSSYLEKLHPADANPNNDEAFGLWRAKKIDALAYQNKLRNEW